MKKIVRALLWIGILASFATPASAELRTISWVPVTAYTDGTPIEAGKTITYSAFWTTDPGLGSLHAIGTSLATTSTTFDPTVLGMPRGGTVYFTTRAVLNTGEASALSPGYAWVVPVVAPPPATLSSIAVSGPSSVNEGATGTFTATATWSDGTNTAVTPTWSENSTYATISSSGLFTASPVTANQTATVTASYTSGGVTRTATRSVTIVDVAATLSSIAISGPSSVNEGATGTFTATATWSDGTNMAVTPAWSASLGTISGAGQFTAPSVTANQTATVTATFGGSTATRSVTVIDAPAGLASITVIGPSSVTEGATGTFTATGTWDNGTTAAINPTWSEDSSYATITPVGLLTASAVTSNQPVAVTATYGGRTGTIGVTIVDVPSAVPAPPKNIDLTGPISSVSSSSVSMTSLSAPAGQTAIYRLNWDPVTTNLDGTPIEPGRTVLYTAYWSEDPALSASSLRTLGSSIPGTTLEFEPSANQMGKNKIVHLAVRAILDTGEASPLSACLTWRAENAGPVPPAKGRIIKK